MDNPTTNVHFCRTDFDYINPANGFGSYRDFFHLAALSGFPIIKVQDIDPASDNVYIISPVNGEWKHGWESPRARIILWNLEQDGYEPIPGVAETWVSDATLAERTGARYVLMGSHPGLAHEFDGDAPAFKQYHVITLTYNTPRREALLRQLQELEVDCAPNGWEQDRHTSLLSSMAMLHIHQNDNKNYAAPQRFALAAAYSLPLITEHLDHRGAFGYSQLLMSDYGNLAKFVREWVCRNDYGVLRDYGHALHQLLCWEHPFRREVEAAL